MLPQTVFGAGQLHAVVVAGRARIELGVGMGGAGPLVVPGDDQRPSPYHASLQFGGCGEFGRGPLDIHLCLSLEGGRIIIDAERERPAPWTLHLTGSPSLTWWLTRRIGLYGGVTIGPALVRSNFYTGLGPGPEAIGERSTAGYLLAGSLGFEFRAQPRNREKQS